MQSNNQHDHVSKILDAHKKHLEAQLKAVNDTIGRLEVADNVEHRKGKELSYDYTKEENQRRKLTDLLKKAK